ncbi:MAG TPA: hypothetical protein VN018_02335 [Brevundimonas sp.]|nr:hypothetical protein [Brevundimonas sp.]
MTRGPVIPSAVDLTDAGNVVQARHELHQAIDFGGPTERAAWSEKWGEAALAAGEKASRETMDFDGFDPPPAVERAIELRTTLYAALSKDEPDIERCRALARQLGDKQNIILEAYEE